MLSDVVLDLMEYFDLTAEAVRARMKKAEDNLACLWRVYQQRQESEPWEIHTKPVDGFYRRADVQTEYIFALTEYWIRDYRAGAVEYYQNYLSGPSILDYGAGTGDLLLHLAHNNPEFVYTYADYPGPKREFAMYRALVNWVPQIVFSDLRPLRSNYDTIICTSVLEHVEDLPAITRMLVDHLNPGGMALFTVDWVYNRDFPCHLPETASYMANFSDLMCSFGCEPADGFWRKKK